MAIININPFFYILKKISEKQGSKARIILTNHNYYIARNLKVSESYVNFIDRNDCEVCLALTEISGVSEL